MPRPPGEPILTANAMTSPVGKDPPVAHNRPRTSIAGGYHIQGFLMPRWVVTQAVVAKQAQVASVALVPHVHPAPAVAAVPPPENPAQPAATSVAATPTADSYAEKLVKYVPAEVLAFALPAAALNAGNDNWLKAIIIAGFVAVPLYLIASARSKPPSQRPPAPYYLLSALAYLPWILGASPSVSGMTGWGQAPTTTILMVAVLFIPVMDQLLDTPPAEPVRVQ